MKQKDASNDIEMPHGGLAFSTGATAEEPDTGRERRDLLVMRAGGRRFAVYADEADNVSEGHRPTPLPNSPPAVLGVVCVRGRMRTLLDPSLLLDAGEPTAPYDAAPDTTAAAASTDAQTDGAASLRFVVSLRGDEQLALAVERVERIVEIFLDEVELHDEMTSPTRGHVLSDEGSPTFILDPPRLFDAAMQGVERRRIR